MGFNLRTSYLRSPIVWNVYILDKPQVSVPQAAHPQPETITINLIDFKTPYYLRLCSMHCQII
jgi:hypothetical protein